MSSRNCYVSNSASTPIENVWLPRTTLSEIEPTSSSLRRRKKLTKNYNSSSSSDPRDSKERLLSDNARMKLSRRRYVSGTPNELIREKKRMKRNERKKAARRQIESSEMDETDWQTTREHTLSAEFDQTEAPIEEAPTRSVNEPEVVENVVVSDDITSYGWEKPNVRAQTNPNRPPEVVRDAARVIDYLERVLERPLLHVPDSRVEKELDIPATVPFIDLDTDSVLNVNDHEKSYLPARQKKACNPARRLGEIGMARHKDRFPQTASNGPEKRLVRNRRVMMELRKRVEEERKMPGRRKPRRSSPPKRSPSCKMATTCGSLVEGRPRIYDFISPFEESDDEVFVVQGLRFLKNPPRPKFFRPAISPETAMNWETDTRSLVPREDENRRAAKRREENEKSASRVIVATAIGSRDRTNCVRSIDDTEEEWPIVENARYVEKSATQKNDGSSNFYEIANHRSKERINRSNLNQLKAASREIGNSSSSKIPSRNRKRIDTRENWPTSDADSIADRRHKTARPTRPYVAESHGTSCEKSLPIGKADRVNSAQNRPSGPFETDENDSSADDFMRRPIKRRRITSGRTKSGESSRGMSLKSVSSDRKADEKIGKKSAPSRPLENSINRQEKKKSLQRPSSTDVEGPSKKKYRRIVSLIYADTSTSPEVSARIIDDIPPNENSRPSFSKNEEPADWQSDDTLIIDRENMNEWSFGQSASAENTLNTIVEETSMDDSRKGRNKKRKTVRRSLSSSLSLTKSHRNSSTSLPKILKTTIFRNSVVERCSSNRWQIHVSKDSDDS